jgi:hypothetical protein
MFKDYKFYNIAIPVCSSPLYISHCSVQYCCISPTAVYILSHETIWLLFHSLRQTQMSTQYMRTRRCTRPPRAEPRAVTHHVSSPRAVTHHVSSPLAVIHHVSSQLSVTHHVSSPLAVTHHVSSPSRPHNSVPHNHLSS